MLSRKQKIEGTKYNNSLIRQEKKKKKIEKTFGLLKPSHDFLPTPKLSSLFRSAVALAEDNLVSNRHGYGD